MKKIENIILQEICGNKLPGGYTEKQSRLAKNIAQAIATLIEQKIVEGQEETTQRGSKEMKKEMRKVKVEREMPGCIIGEEYVPNKDSTFGFDCFKGVTIEYMVEEGWLSWVEEEKNLDEKFRDIKNLERINEDHYSIPREKRGTYLTYSSSRKLTKIAADHFKEKFDKATKSGTIIECNDPKTFNLCKLIRKALFGETP